jgi:hypothetical protein
MNAPFKNPLNITLMTLGGMWAVSANRVHWFQGDVLFHVHSMRCGGDEPNNLEDNCTRNMSTMMINGCEDERVSISMDDRQRSPILDELSA